MSFPKGPRFEPQQISDVPGPNSYNLCQESQLEAYKRGAFLEKADRFSKDLLSEVPGPGTYSTATNGKTESKSNSKPPPNLGDRYAILQRKVEDLERIHNEGKKAHQVEVDRLKLELARSQKAATEHADCLEKQKKQNAILDVRIQDLKKTSSTEQAELKDLRVKLKMSEHERTQLFLKQGEAGELKKAMQALESKRRDEIRERDRLIADLEKSATGEKKKRELAEARLQEIQGTGDVELRAARATATSLEVQLTQSQEETRRAVQALAITEADAAEQQRSLIDQLEQHRLLLSTVAEEYGRLAAGTVSTTVHSKLRHEHGVLQMRTWRLERKLANSEGQITELVNLIHYAHDTNAVLVRQIRDLQEECDFHCRTPPDGLYDLPQLMPLYDALTAAMHDIHETELSICRSDNILTTTLVELYRLTYGELTGEYLATNAELGEEQLVSRNLRARQGTLEAELEQAQQERDDRNNELTTTKRMVDDMKTSVAWAEQQSSDYEQKMKAAIHQSEMVATNDKNALHQLTETVKRNRMTEDGLRAEIELLTTELADCEQFQAAYYSLSDEVNSLIARNELAEGEAQQLSKFNAEILGHHNPAQRIMYVDRIRRELAEIKHKFAVGAVELESMTARNAELVREIEMYKSASVPLVNKPRTIVTRISRPPLSALNQSTTTASGVVWEKDDAVPSFEEFSYAI
ncbi:hypothetical protein DFH07DRAFT_845306 [Mycena maculata]|uniref:Uncharacterized protein n=1 Tax=Mycena maculata TaxID=230809 RepID=A0AAD7I3L5_9AGAR|nr:hypothetical protein DFH07DRAFT_845306 [Mycena maculata]